MSVGVFSSQCKRQRCAEPAVIRAIADGFAEADLMYAMENSLHDYYALQDNAFALAIAMSLDVQLIATGDGDMDLAMPKSGGSIGVPTRQGITRPAKQMRGKQTSTKSRSTSESATHEHA